MKTNKNLTTSFLLIVAFLFGTLKMIYAIPDQMPGKTVLGSRSNQHKASQSAQSNALTITLDASKIGQPISPYIYGEFIEHQGRCIYGGIGQDSIELVQGRDYTGHIVLMGSETMVVKVSLIWGTGISDKQTITINNLTPGSTPTPLNYTSAAGTVTGLIEITGERTGCFNVGTLSLMPADNFQGREVAVLVNEMKQPGEYTVTFNTKELQNGLYFYQLMAGDGIQARKFLIKRQ
jgi:hypothetical protein